MKRATQIFFALAAYLSVYGQSNENTVNAVIGDVSYFEGFHQKPTNNTNELLRLQTHLSYVEKMLAQKPVLHLSNDQKLNRTLVIKLLHQYWSNGVFPKNYDYEQRRPCFIDRDGNICAVGYLIEKTAGREAAEAINREHKYDYLLDMNEEVIREWADKHGLTLEECAMIQPSYGSWPVPPIESYDAPLKTGYGISTGFATGINAGVNIMNLSSRFKSSKTLAYIGLVTGTTQVILGLVNLKKDDVEYSYTGSPQNISYQTQNNVSYFNLAAGTTTIFTSAVNLLINNRMKDKKHAFNLYSLPNYNNKLVAGLSFTRSL